MWQKNRREKLYNVMMGLHSHIPVCCIKYFVSKYSGDYRDENYGSDDPSVGYIPCPKCRRSRRFKRVHECDYRCSQYMMNAKTFTTCLELMRTV